MTDRHGAPGDGGSRRLPDDDPYRVLGVERGATSAELRAAYRREARRHHPDRHGDGTSDAMARVNAAYQVLSDPLRRAAHDRVGHDRTGQATDAVERAATEQATASGSAAPSAAHHVDRTPARFPWRFVAFMAAVGAAVVVAGVILYKPSPAPPPDNVLRPGDCVVLSASLEATEVGCSDPHDARVQVLVPVDQPCPAGTEGWRDHQGMGTACIVRSTT